MPGAAEYSGGLGVGVAESTGLGVGVTECTGVGVAECAGFAATEGPRVGATASVGLGTDSGVTGNAARAAGWLVAGCLVAATTATRCGAVGIAVTGCVLVRVEKLAGP